MTVRAPQPRRQRILMTIDAVGGVWRYAIDLATGLRAQGIETVFAVFGPPPSATQRHEAQAVGTLIQCNAPLDWMVAGPEELERVPHILFDVARRESVDLLHLNLPSQAAGIEVDLPVVVVSHSCVATWFHAVQGVVVPEPWQWQVGLNRKGFERAEAVLAPSHSHAALLQEVYGPIDRLDVVYNASRVGVADGRKDEVVFAAARWWDDGKNGAVLDAAAQHIRWPVVMAGAHRGPNGQFLPIRNAVHRGELSHSETMALMAGATIAVSPSLYEPFGLAALEAARCGSALVLADNPTYRELWEGAALFADPHDPKAFETKINRLIADVGLRADLAMRARNRSLDFTMNAQCAAMTRIYAQLSSPASNAAE